MLVAIIYRFLIVSISFDIFDSFTAVKHPKTAFNLSKFIEYSNIITQELETVKKNPNTFERELVAIEHPKTATKLSRFIKKPKIITQQPKKQKFIQSQKSLIVHYN